jgi:UDP-3-O-[3-hydroxymyristoyl] glucosamine N-acyltransferase
LRENYVAESFKNLTLIKLAGLLGESVEIKGDGAVVISGVCSIDNPKTGHIALAEHPEKIAWDKYTSRPAAIIVRKAFDSDGLPLLITENPRIAFTHILKHFYFEDEFSGGIDPHAVVASDTEIDATSWIGPLAVIESGSRIGPGVRIGAGCYIGKNSSIGDNSFLHPNVTILKDVTVGKRCIFHSGVVIGSDGFGYTQSPDGNLKVMQVGGIQIGDDVEIGANTTIDRATLDMTIIGNDVKIDNLVQIAHNVKIGDHTRIAAMVGVPGRVIIENDVVIGGQAGLQNGITVGEGSVIGGGSGVTKSVRKHSIISGYPADDHKKALHLLAMQKRLPEMMERLDNIEKYLEMKRDCEV